MSRKPIVASNATDAMSSNDINYEKKLETKIQEIGKLQQFQSLRKNDKKKGTKQKNRDISVKNGKFKRWLIKEDRYFMFITFSVKIYTELCYREGQTDSTSVDIRQIFFRFELKRRSMYLNFRYRGHL